MLMWVLVAAVLPGWMQAQGVDEFASHFRACKVGSDNFDNCMKKALNDVRSFFPTGIPEYGVLPFDPFFAKEVVQKRGGRAMNYKLKLNNVYESGWSISNVTNFRSNLDKGEIRYSQHFPKKSLSGEYEMDSRVLLYPVATKGSFNLTLYNYTQTTTISRRDALRPFKVRIVADGCKDMELHVGNLLGGREVMERVLDRVINASWEPGFTVMKPLIDDLVSTAFTDIFNKSFKKFPFDQVFPR